MTELETSNGCDKYILDEALQAVLKFNWKSLWLLRYFWLGLSLKHQSNECNQLQLDFVTDLLQQTQLDDTNVSNSYLLFTSY